MMVTVLFLAQLRDAAGTARMSLECQPACTVQELVLRLAAANGGALGQLLLDDRGRLAPTILLALDGRALRWEETTELGEASVVLLGTPVAGG
ncbi:MAG: MoaD/ThiS family protein [Planctomycetota bacterium]